MVQEKFIRGQKERTPANSRQWTLHLKNMDIFIKTHISAVNMPLVIIDLSSNLSAAYIGNFCAKAVIGLNKNLCYRCLTVS